MLKITVEIRNCLDSDKNRRDLKWDA